MEELPSRFILSPLEDDAPPVAEDGTPAEPLGDAEAIVPTEEGTEGGAASTLTADEWADLVAVPGNYQRLAEAPRAMHGEILAGLMAKNEARSRSIADRAAADALERGKEAGRIELARELVVQNIDKMESFERDELFRQNPGAEQLWHESHAVKQPATTAAATNFAQQIVDQGNAQLQRLQNHPEYKPVFDEMLQGKYAADPSGLAQLAARVERALATNQVVRDDAEATAKNRAAALLKSSPKTVGVGMGGAAAAGPLTAERMLTMNPAEALEFMNSRPDGMEQIARATQELSKSLA